MCSVICTPFCTERLKPFIHLCFYTTSQSQLLSSTGWYAELAALYKHHSKHEEVSIIETILAAVPHHLTEGSCVELSHTELCVISNK